VNGAWRGNIGVEFFSSEGTRAAVLILNINIVFTTPHLISTPNFLTKSAVRGSQTFYQFAITNIGSAPTNVIIKL
jgi:hypothetical protein